VAASHTAPSPRPSAAERLFSFPNPVNEVSARLVAGGVVLLSAAALLTQEPWVIAIIAYGFLARVLTGPTLSPLGQLVTRVVTPRLGLPERPVAGPPKRFAQGIGAVLSVTAAVLAIGFGEQAAANVLLALLVAAASLESFLGFCLGCKIFAGLMKAGIVPAEVCERCNDIWAGRPPSPETT
jgi:Domain of unknown function (DUF4395)